MIGVGSVSGGGYGRSGGRADEGAGHSVLECLIDLDLHPVGQDEGGVLLHPDGDGVGYEG